MILTAGAAPIFLSKNYIHKDLITLGQYSVTSMQALLKRIVDMDPYAYWQSSGSSDAVMETITMSTVEGNTITLHTDVGLIALLNINLKEFYIRISADYGVSWVGEYSVVDNTLENYILDISAAPKSVNYILIGAHTTIVPNQEKRIGTLVVAGLKKQMLNVPDFPIVRKDIENVKILQMANGSENVTRIKRSEASCSFFAATYKFSYVTYAELVAMRTFRRDNPEFLFYPEPYEKPGEIFHCRFDGPFVEQESAQYKGAGYNLQFSVKEIA
jgi:hypothetical protein